jgi:hypothetical protein
VLSHLRPSLVEILRFLTPTRHTFVCDRAYLFGCAVAIITANSDGPLEDVQAVGGDSDDRHLLHQRAPIFQAGRRGSIRARKLGLAVFQSLACQVGGCWRRAGLPQGGENAALPARRFGRMGASAHRRASEVVFGQSVNAPYGEVTPQLPASQNPSQLFGGRNRPPVRQAQEHGPGMAQGRSRADRQEPPSPCPWASLGGPSQGATHGWKASKPARPPLLLQMP